MNVLIGFWLIGFGLAILFTFLFGMDFDLKEKIGMIFLVMLVFTLLLAGAYLMTGGK